MYFSNLIFNYINYYRESAYDFFFNPIKRAQLFL